MSLTFQPGILRPLAECGRSVSLVVRPEADPRPALLRLRQYFDPLWGVVGIGEPLALALGRKVPGLRPFPALAGSPHILPSHQNALWIFLRAPDRATIFDLSQKLAGFLAPAFDVADAIDTFAYAGRDLTGYVDGTANPEGEEAIEAAIAKDASGTPQSSFAAVQRWVHDLKRFHARSTGERDAMIGRRHSDNEEIDDAPESAHVKRAAQEMFDPTAFMVRRSQPWATNEAQGLEFIAYGASLDAFERVLRRMAGLDDGVSDALFAFTRPVNGAYYWCPPLSGHRLDLSLLGL